MNVTFSEVASTIRRLKYYLFKITLRNSLSEIFPHHMNKVTVYILVLNKQLYFVTRGYFFYIVNIMRVCVKYYACCLITVCILNLSAYFCMTCSHLADIYWRNS